MTKIGYARVSTTDQDLYVQHEKLKAQDCDIVRSEKVSGASRDGREELKTVIDFLRPDDELMVTRLDRLGRDTRDVLNIIHDCEQKEAFVTVLDPYVSTQGEMGHLVITVLGMVAQMERRFIKERQRDGIQRAKAKGVYKGGQRRIDRKAVIALSHNGKTSTQIAAETGCSGFASLPYSEKCWVRCATEQLYKAASNIRSVCTMNRTPTFCAVC